MKKWFNKNGITIVGTIIFVLLFIGIFGIRLWMANGDLGCTFSKDPQTCVAIKEVGR